MTTPNSLSPLQRTPLRETAAAKQAFGLFMQLAPPRRTKELIGRRLKGKDGSIGMELKQHTLELWSKKYHWRDREAELEDEAFAREQEAALQWRIKERDRRERSRLAAAEAQRMMAMQLLIDPETKLPRKMQDIEARYLQIANDMLKESGQSERLDLGQATERIEDMGGRRGTTINHNTMVVLDNDAKSQLRGLIEALPERTLLPDGSVIDPLNPAIVDAVVVNTDDDDDDDDDMRDDDKQEEETV